ncbi:hypothetical protein TruAng_005362 [Truncatella angustata]|nr:hypothetical protein TruAng_005362 [Truncatella angustata]
MARPRAPQFAGFVILTFRIIAITLSVILLASCIYETVNWDGDHKTYGMSYAAAIVALIVDGIEVVSLLDSTRKIKRVHPGCLVCEDIIVACLLGPSIVFILFSDYRLRDAPSDYPRPWRQADHRTLVVTTAAL